MMSDRLRALLLKAVRSLEPAEQDEVLGHLLVGDGGGGGGGGGASRSVVFSPPPQPMTFPGPRPSAGERAALVEEITSTLGIAAGDLKMLPVRLPSADYETLRVWSREHGFSMAVIIRTLVERFLASQRPDEAADAGEA
jgi:hypothetical protein